MTIPRYSLLTQCFQPRTSLVGSLFLVFSFWCSVYESSAQSISHGVFSSLAQTQQSGGGIIEFTAGEPLTFTNGPNGSDQFWTQGFHQPEFDLLVPLTAAVINQGNEECFGARDGFIELAIISGTPPYDIQWTSSDTGYRAENLEVGTYYYTATDSNGLMITDSVVIGSNLGFACPLKFYSGITPNNDGNNDFFFVENVEYYDVEDMLVFNRNGDVIWRANGYDNQAIKFEGKDRFGFDIVSGTYFYRARISGENYEGWVELLRE